MALNTRASRNASRAKTSPAWAWSTPKRSRSSSARADGVLARDGVELLLAEGQGHDELAEVVQEAAEVSGLDVGAGALGQGAGDGGHLAGMHVQQPARCSAGARRELEEPADGGLEGETPDVDAADEGDGLAHGLRADGARARGGVGEAQDVGGEPGIGLDRGDELVGVGLGVAGEVSDASQGAVEDRQLADAPDGVLQGGVDRGGVLRRRKHRPPPIFGSADQELSGGRRGAARFGPCEPASERRSALRWLSGRRRGDAGALVGRAALRLVDLGSDHRAVLANTTFGRMSRRDHHPDAWWHG
jgi:hypothetical protein